MNPQINNFEYTFCVCLVLHFLSFVDGFGVDLGAILVSKRGAGGQKETQVVQKSSKMRSRWSPEATLGTTLAPRKFDSIS